MEYITDNTRKLPYDPSCLLSEQHYDEIILGGIYTASPFSASGLDYDTQMMGTQYYSSYDSRCWVFQAMQDPETARIWLIDTFNATLVKEDGRRKVKFSPRAWAWRWRFDEALYSQFSLAMEDVNDWEEARSYEFYDPDDVVHGVCFGCGNHTIECDDWTRRNASPSLKRQIAHVRRELDIALDSAVAKMLWVGEKAKLLEELIEQADEQGISYSDDDGEQDLRDLMNELEPMPFRLGDAVGGDMDTYLASRCLEPGEIFEENGFSSHVYTGDEDAYTLGDVRTLSVDEGERGSVLYTLSHFAIPKRNSIIQVIHREGKIETTFHRDLTRENIDEVLSNKPAAALKFGSFSPEHVNEKLDAQMQKAKKMSNLAEVLRSGEGGA